MTDGVQFREERNAAQLLASARVRGRGLAWGRRQQRLGDLGPSLSPRIWLWASRLLRGGSLLLKWPPRPLPTGQGPRLSQTTVVTVSLRETAILALPQALPLTARRCLCWRAEGARSWVQLCREAWPWGVMVSARAALSVTCTWLPPQLFLALLVCVSASALRGLPGAGPLVSRPQPSS